MNLLFKNRQTIRQHWRLVFISPLKF